MSDLDAQLAFLRAQRDAAPNASARDMFEQLLATLEQQAAPAEATPSQSHIQHIGGYTTIAMALAGDVPGDIYIVGARTKSTKVLLAGYLRWLASQCGQLPLRGVREQKAATDVLNIGLDQVYTQLATEVLVIREMFAGAALEQLDVQAFVREHVGDLLLPGRQRRIMAATPIGREHRAEHVIAMSQGRDGFDLRTLPADELTRTIQGATDITFYGPQLVT